MQICKYWVFPFLYKHSKKKKNPENENIHTPVVKGVFGKVKVNFDMFINIWKHIYVILLYFNFFYI